MRGHLLVTSVFAVLLPLAEPAASADGAGADAAAYGNCEARLAHANGGVLRDMLGRDVSPTAVDDHGWTDLHWAAALNLPELAVALLDAGVRVDVPLRVDWSAAGLLLERLYSVGIYMEIVDGLTPLDVAAHVDALEVVEVLLARGATFDVRRSQGFTPLMHAVAADAVSTAARLIEHVDDRLDQADLDALLDLRAYYRGATGTIEMLIDLGADVDAVGEFGRTPLQSAAYGNAADAVIALIARGADIHATSPVSGYTALHIAIVGHHASSEEAAVVLIEHGADIHAKSRCGRTPLHVTTVEDVWEIAQMLIVRGADVHVQDQDGLTPLHLAAGYNAADVAAVLLEFGAEVEMKDGKGWTPLHYAAREGHPEAIVTLLVAGADPDAKLGSLEEAPLHLAAVNGDPESIDALLAGGANPGARNRHGDTPLHYAERHGNREAVAALKVVAREFADSERVPGGVAPGTKQRESY